MPRTLARVVLALGLALHAPTAGDAQDVRTPRLDRFGDPLPAGVLGRLGTVRFHRCSCAAYSPDGKVIATAAGDEVNLWDAATSRRIRRLALENRKSAVGLIFSHDGKKLAAIGWGGTSVEVWDLGTANKVHLAQAEGGSAGGDWSNAAAFSSDDRTLFAATSSTLFAWDVASGKKLKQFPLRVKGGPVPVRMLTFSEDGKVMATKWEKKVHLWDTRTGTLLHELQALSGGEAMRFSRDGKTLVVPGSGHWMNLFDVQTGKKVRSLAVSDRVVSLAFSPDGKTLAAASNGTVGSSSTEGAQVIQLWDLTKPQAPPVKFPAPGIHSVTFSPDGKTLAWGCHRQTLCFMDRATGKDRHPVASHRGAIKSLVYLPDGKRIGSASEDGTIRVWDAATGKPLGVLRGHVGEVSGLALHPSGKLLASCGRDGTFRLWDVEGGNGLAVLNDERNSVVAAAFSADGKRLASGGHRGVVFLRDPATGGILDEIEAGSIASLAFSPDGKTLAALAQYGDGGLLLYDLGTKKARKIPLKGGGSCVAYSPDGKVLAVARDETLLLLDPATDGVVRTLPGHYNRRGCVAFSPDGRYLASVSDGYGLIANRSIRVFEVASGTEIHPFKKELPVFAAAFSPDGSKLVVGGADATAVVLDLRNLTGKKRRDRLTENELSNHWEGLGTKDAAKAYEARVDLLHAPESAVPFLAKRLRPAPAIDLKHVEGLIKSLDSDSFRERDAAARELAQLGELVREPLRKAVAGNPPLEKRRRLQALLGRLDEFSPSQLRTVRAIEILEGIGTPEALRVVERLTRGNADGLVTVESRKVVARSRQRSAPLPEAPIARKVPAADAAPLPPGPVLLDREGDPMPAGAVARLGSARWRLSEEPRRIIVSADGKRLAVVNGFAGVDILDARTGRSIERANFGAFGWGLDLRMAAALSADGRKLARLEAGERSGVVLAVLDRGKAGKVTIDYGRKKESYPLVPEEVEDAGSYSSGAFEYLSAAAFSPDGKTLVGSVRFEWHCSGGKVKKELKESHVIAWDASTGKEVWKVLVPAREVNTLLFAHDGKTLTVVDRAGVGFWDPAAGREMRRWQSKDPLFSARYSPDGKWLATGSKEEILLWEADTGKLLRRLTVPGKEIKAVAFSPDGKLLAGGGEKTIRFWDPLTGKSRGDCSAFPSAVQAVAFSRDGKTLFSGHEQEHVLRRWDVAGRKPLGEFSSPVTPVRMLAFSRDSRRILASATGERFYLWDAETGKPCPLPDKEDRLLADCLASSGRAGLLRCEEGFGSQFAMLLTGKVDRLDQLPGFLGSSVDGRRVLLRSEKKNMPCLSVRKVRGGKAKDKGIPGGEVEREFVWKEGGEVSAALSPDGKTVAAAGKDVVCFFDVATGRERRHQHSTRVGPELLFRTQSVKFSADGSRVALVGDGGKVRILAVKDGRRIAEVATRSSPLTGLAFSPDGQTLLTTSFGDRVYAWEVATGQMVRRFEPATYLFSPDNRMLAGSARTLKVFDLYSGQVLRECGAGGSPLDNFAFSPDSKLLAASCPDTTISVWPASAARPMAGKLLAEKGLARALEAGGAADAYAAIGRMIADPERAIPFLERRLRPVPTVDAGEARRLIADLDGDRPNRREEATKRLAQLGPLAEPALRAALSSQEVPPGSRGRIEKLLHDLGEKQTALSAEDVLHVRAIQALERIGTRRARQLLESLARGAEGSPRTRAAVEALARIKAH